MTAMRLGTWTPGGFAPWITLAGKLTLFSLMLIRGVDYITDNNPDSLRRLSLVEAAAPITVWGGACVLAAAVGFAGILVRKGGWIFWGHALGWCLYWALGVGVALDVVERSHGLNVTVVVSALILVVGEILAHRARHSHIWPYYSPTITALSITGAILVVAPHLDGIRNATVLFGVNALHMLMAIGTASQIRQEQIRHERR